MKNILVPVGSSSNVVSHLQYAVDFAQAFGAKLYVVQIYNVTTKAGTMINVDQILEEEGNKYIRSLLSKIDKKDVEIASKTIKGSLIDTLDKLTNMANIDLILVEPRTNSKKEEVYLGNTSGKIIKQMDVPAALIVPEGYVFKPFEHVLMALKSAIIRKDNVLAPLSSVKERSNPVIDLLLVRTPDFEDGDFEINEELAGLISKTTETENATTFQGVLRHYESHNPDLLCVVRRKRGFFAKIWEKNAIMRKDFSSPVPVLVLSGLK